MKKYSLSLLLSILTVIPAISLAEIGNYNQYDDSQHYRERLCDGVYQGSYSERDGILKLELRPIARGRVEVYFTFRGQSKMTYGYCDTRGLSFSLVRDYEGQFMRDEYGRILIRGVRYDNGRADKRFVLRKMY